MRCVHATAIGVGWLAFLLGCGGSPQPPPSGQPTVLADEPTLLPRPKDEPPKPEDEQKPSFVDQVAIWIMAEGPEASAELDKVAAMGERVFPAFEKILDEPEYSRAYAWRVFVVLRMMKCDRNRFLDRAVAALGDKDGGVRDCAIRFLESAGGEAEAAPLALLVLSESSVERRSAAEAIAAIGGKGQLAVFDLVIKNATRYEVDGKLILNNFDIERFEECRNKLDERLKKQQKGPKATPPEKK